MICWPTFNYSGGRSEAQQFRQPDRQKAALFAVRLRPTLEVYMGAWGTGLYSDDTTCDVRDDYIRLLKSGHSSEEATHKIIRRFSNLMTDRQIECLVILPLAETQWKYGRLLSSIKERALDLLLNGGDLEFWDVDGPSDVEARRQVLKRLRAKLESAQPEPKPIALSKLQERPKKVRMTAPVRSVFLLPITEKICLPLVLLAYRDLEKSVEPIFCVFPTAIDPESPLLSNAFSKPPLELETGSGPQTVFGAFPNDERRNPYKQLQEIGIVQDIQLPSVPESPTFFSFGGMVSRIIKALHAQSHP